MAVIYGEFTNLSGYDGYQRTYEDNRWTREEVLQPQISIDDVMSVQALAMGFLRHRSRTRLPVSEGQKRHGFALLNNLSSDDSQFYDGSTEEYMACRIAKTAHDQWRMRVRFRTNELAEESKTKSYFDDFSFDWLRNGNLQAWYGVYAVSATGIGTFEEWRDIHPIVPDEVVELRERMSNFVETVNPGNETSIFNPVRK